MDDYEKVKVIYDYVVKYVFYDMFYKVYIVYEVFVNCFVVC